MRNYTLPHTNLNISRIAYGCMNIGGGWNSDSPSGESVAAAERIIHQALDCGINLFDHADIYMFGKCETVFGNVLKKNPGLRENIVLQTKCGIRFADPDEPFCGKRYDFSKEHIIRSVDESLMRLQTDTIDILLLHRPDALVEPEEVSGAFDALWGSGKVKHFGLSNHTAARMRMMSKHIRQPLIINQVQLSLMHHMLIEEEMLANHTDARNAGYSGALDHCREHSILIQAWSPLAQGKPLSEEGRLRDCIVKLAEKHQVAGEAIILAWLLRHPARIQPIIGTTNSDRIKKCCEADSVNLSREEWYMLYEIARGGELP